MGVEEELKEKIEEARDPFDKRVAGTMAVMAAALAVVSVIGHMATTEEIVNQAKASDQWAYYQAKSIRRYESEIARDVLAAQATKAEEYSKNVEKYSKEGEEIQKEAQALENESKANGRQAARMEFAEIFLEVAIVLASLAILTKIPAVWWFSIVTGLGGVAVALTSFATK
jgi:Flp pilus assembly protein TadB